MTENESDTQTGQLDADHPKPVKRTRKPAVDAAANAVASDAAAVSADAAAIAARNDEAASPATGSAAAGGTAADGAAAAAQRAGDMLSGVAGDVAARVSAHAPAAIDASRATVGIAAREVRSASPENLMLGAVFSSGVALGLMLARASRILVLLALVPVVVAGVDLIGRRTGRGPSTTGNKPATKR